MSIERVKNKASRPLQTTSFLSEGLMDWKSVFDSPLNDFWVEKGFNVFSRVTKHLETNPRRFSVLPGRILGACPLSGGL